MPSVDTRLPSGYGVTRYAIWRIWHWACYVKWHNIPYSSRRDTHTAHMISINNGRAELAYAGATPWHGLGTMVEGLQTAADMLRHAGLLWTVSTRPLFSERVEGGAPDLALTGYRAVIRDDNHVPLGVVSKGYTPIQNTAAGDVVDALVTEGGAVVEVAGALDQGHRCWMLARVPGSFDVVPGDEVRPYVVLAWGHDGKHGLAAKRTATRVVCNNTLGAALGAKWSKTADVFVKHSASASIRLDEARTALGLIRKGAAETADAYRALAATRVTDAQVGGYFVNVFGAAPERDLPGYDERLARWNATQERLVSLYQGGQGSQIPGVRGSAWGAYNAVTEYVDHVYPVLQSGKVSAERQQSAAFGTYATTKADALALALDLVA